MCGSEGPPTDPASGFVNPPAGLSLNLLDFGNGSVGNQ